MRILVFLAFLFSGFTGLVLENLWMRLLVQVFGGTTLAIVTILTAYMGGLALGSYLAGKIVARIRRPLVWYGVLELSIAGYALLFPLILEFLPTMYLWLPQTGSFYLTALLRFFLCLILLLVPTACMGATLPVLSLYLARSREQVGFDVGLLYSINTFGAVAGALVGGFVLLPLLGHSKTLWLVCGGLSSLAVLLVLLGRSYTVEPSVETNDEPASSEDKDAAAEGDDSSESMGVLVWCLGITGGLAMICQVLWSRALTMVIGSSTYAFSLILGIFLSGLASGALWGAWVSKTRENIRTLWSWLLVFTAVTIGVGSLVLGWLPEWFGSWLFSMSKESRANPLGMFSLKAFMAAIPLIVPTFFMGAFFPLAMAEYGRRRRVVGESVGQLYAASTLGSIVGSGLAGFAVIPLLGLQGGLALCVCLYLLCAWMIGYQGEVRQHVVLGGIAVAGSLMVWLSPGWQPERMSAGFFRVALTETHNFQQIIKPGKLLYYKEGMSATITVQQAGRQRFMKINGKIDASNIGDSDTQMGLAGVPLMVHPNPKDIMVIGWGSGMTSGAALRFPVRRVDAIELEPAVIEASKFFEPWNLNPMKDKRLHLIYNDALNHMAVVPQMYDVIISQPSNPWLSGVANLFTVEFFQLTAQKLRKNGILCQWLPIYELSFTNIFSILRSVHHVYPHFLLVETSQYSSNVLILASRQPLQFHTERIKRVLKLPQMRPVLQGMKVRDVHDLLLRYVADESILSRLLKKWPAPLNTHEHNRLEFTSPFDLIAMPTTKQDMVEFRAMVTRWGQDITKHLRLGKKKPSYKVEGDFWYAFIQRSLYYGMFTTAQRHLDRLAAAQPKYKKLPALRNLWEHLTGKSAVPMAPQPPTALKLPDGQKPSAEQIKAQHRKLQQHKFLMTARAAYKANALQGCLRTILPVTRRSSFEKHIHSQVWFFLGRCFARIKKYPDALYSFAQYQKLMKP
ncbi:MAG: hypothetical protein EP343_07530 [Deltaproteobacteria bacterium]|nr:MAG: hypothetical protein EP343_07530 [Deltaproteobacteria bacterium]